MNGLVTELVLEPLATVGTAVVGTVLFGRLGPPGKANVIGPPSVLMEVG